MIREIFNAIPVGICRGCGRLYVKDGFHVCDNLDSQFRRYLQTTEGKVAEFDAENDRGKET